MYSLLLKIVLLLALLSICFESQAIWFEASGQAQVHNGNKKQARERATQEAIKQALMFSGASVTSVQKMANGLLQDDRFEIRSSGEVSAIELIDEIYGRGMVTVSIRADIFPQKIECRAADYQKSIVTPWLSIANKNDLNVGEMQGFGQVLAAKLQKEFELQSSYVKIKQLLPYALYPEQAQTSAAALSLAKKADSQFVMFAQVRDFALESASEQSWLPWSSHAHVRPITIDIAVYDGTTGEQVWQTSERISPVWPFPPNKAVGVNSEALWGSTFGQELSQLLRELVQEIDQNLRCLPAHGRVLHAANGQITVNIGSDVGVKQGDSLSLFQVSQFFDANGQVHQQVILHPQKVEVSAVYANTAVVVVPSGAYLANIQANDFVSRR